jgi:hypothetical protein
VIQFITPLDDGLIFGEMQRNDFNGVADLALAAPLLRDFHNGVGFEHRLFDYHSNGRERLMVVLRTYIGRSQLKDTQRRLKEELNSFINRHRRVLECYKLRARLAFDGDPPYGSTHYKLYVDPPVTTSQREKALSDLEQITCSTLWTDEINRSIENVAKRSALKTQLS